jgi:hypothetical protein
VLIPHWIEHNGEHADEFRTWASRASEAGPALFAAARLLAEANGKLEEALAGLGGALQDGHR